MAKRYFAEHGVVHREIDVTRDSRGLHDLVQLTGRQAVPVIRVGERTVVGWDEKEFARLYRSATSD
ncbi:MAG: glutaredoxin family protein [Actinobacteria bacterium]|nr:MAG: glutaredoxin family protein [Actinomycetota bacterium]